MLANRTSRVVHHERGCRFVSPCVEAAVRRVLGSQADVRNGGVRLTPGWDSLGQIQIVLAVEEEFGAPLP